MARKKQTETKEAKEQATEATAETSIRIKDHKEKTEKAVEKGEVKKKEMKEKEAGEKKVEGKVESKESEGKEEKEKGKAKKERSPEAFHQNFVYKKVDSISFGVLSPKFIKQMASAKIVTPELYDKEGYPVDGGLMDTRLGVIDPGLKCKTCSSKLKECIGHFGYIELARPIIHIKFIPQVYDAIRATCGDCGRILMPQEKMEKTLKKARRLEEEESVDARRKFAKEMIFSCKTAQKCPHCNAKSTKITLEKPSTFLEGDKRMSPIEIR